MIDKIRIVTKIMWTRKEYLFSLKKVNKFIFVFHTKRPWTWDPYQSFCRGSVAQSRSSKKQETSLISCNYQKTTVHPIVHVGRFRKHLFVGENKLDDTILVDFVEPPTQSHESKRVLDYHNLQTRQHIRRQALIKWKDCSKDDFTWENISVLWKRYPTFVFEDKNSSIRGE